MLTSVYYLGPIPRNPQIDFLSRIPNNVTIVGEIKSFVPSASNFKNTQIELVNGTVSPTFTLLSYVIIIIVIKDPQRCRPYSSRNGIPVFIPFSPYLS